MILGRRSLTRFRKDREKSLRISCFYVILLMLWLYSGIAAMTSIFITHQSRLQICGPCPVVARRDEADGSAVNPQKMEVRYERYFNEAVIRGRCSFWTSDKKMEP